MAKYHVKAYGDEDGADNGLKTQHAVIEAKNREEAYRIAWEMFPGYEDIGVCEVRKLCGHVVVYAVDCSLRLAATIGDLMADGVETVGNAVEAVAEAALDAADAVLQIIKLETCVDVRAGCHALKAVSAEAEAAAHAAPTEEGRHDDQSKKAAPTAAAEHVVVVTA